MLTLEEVRGIQLDLLAKVQDICQSEHLTYYGIGGTLLGAVRHSGYIPWDDDIDLGMPRQDFERFRQYCQTSLGDDYFLQTDVSDNAYPFGFDKLRKQGTYVCEPYLERLNMNQGVYIDIFPMDFCPQNKGIGILYSKLFQIIQTAIFMKSTMEYSCGYEKIIPKVATRLLCILSPKKLKNLRRNLLKTLKLFSNSNYRCTFFGTGFLQNRYCTDWLETGTYLPFESTSIQTPMDWDSALKTMYGDYMVPPPLHQRQGHIIVKQEGDTHDQSSDSRY